MVNRYDKMLPHLFQKIYKKHLKREILIWVIALGTIMVQIVGYIVLQHLDADDSFFVAEISTILQTNYINKIDFTTGIQNYNV